MNAFFAQAKDALVAGGEQIGSSIATFNMLRKGESECVTIEGDFSGYEKYDRENPFRFMVLYDENDRRIWIPEGQVSKEEFLKLPPFLQRMLIAQDVINRLDAQKIVPLNGSVFGSWTSGSYVHGEVSPQDFINNNSCEACAKGALVCSWVGNFNEVTWREIRRTSSDVVNAAKYDTFYPKELVEIFGANVLDLIEFAFEGTSYAYHNHGYRVKRESRDSAFIRINSPYFGDLRAIMQNIVDNKGEFVFDWKEFLKDGQTLVEVP